MQSDSRMRAIKLKSVLLSTTHKMPNTMIAATPNTAPMMLARDSARRIGLGEFSINSPLVDGANVP